MSELITPDVASFLLPNDFKAIMSESESDSEEACDLPIPFANLNDSITLENVHSVNNFTLEHSQYVDNNATLEQSENIADDTTPEQCQNIGDDFKHFQKISNDTILQNSQHIDIDIYSDTPLTIDSEEIDNKLNDSSSNLPVVTPKKSCESSNLDPVTPTANLKMLMNVLSPMIRDRENRKRFNNLIEAAEKSREEECVSETNDPQGDEENDKNSGGTNRKAKSLGLLCQKFLSRYPDYPEDGQVLAIPLDIVSKDLNVERRRIYDIVNVLESVEMVSRRAKNKYVWHGKANLISTLTRLQEIGEKENYGTRMTRLKRLQMHADFEIDLKLLAVKRKPPLSDSSNIQKTNGTEEKAESRKEKSLGVMSQKFIMLFLVSKESRLISLDDAARILIGDEDFLIDESSKLKTKVRRLYDIANILSSLQLIKKVHVTETRGRKPAFKWIGPHPNHTEIDIKTIAAEKRPVTKHSLLRSAPSPNTSSSRKRSWGRHSSFNVMCDVVAKERKAFYSAPSTPVKQEQALDESFQADFEELKRKYPDQVSSLVTRKLCNGEDISTNNLVQETSSTVLPIPRLVKNNNTAKVTNGSGPCRALFGGPADANSSLLKDSGKIGSCNDSNGVFSDGDGKQDTCKRSFSIPNSEFQQVVKKSKPDVDAIALLQQHGFTKAQVDDLMKEGKTLKVMRVFPGTDELAKTYVTTDAAANPKDIQEDLNLLCQETISPLPKKTIKEMLKDDGCMAGTCQTILPKTIDGSASPGSIQNGNSSENMPNLSTSNLNDTPIKPDGIDITKFPTKKLYTSSPRVPSHDSSPRLVPSHDSSPRLVSSQGRYLLSWMAPASSHCQSTCGTNTSAGRRLNPATHAATLHKNSPTADSVSFLPPSSQSHYPMMTSPLAIPHQMHPAQFRSQPVGLSRTTTTTSSSRISPVPMRISPVPTMISPTPLRLSPYQYPYLPSSRYKFQHHQEASSLLKGLTNLSPIQPTTKPNPYITPPSGSLMQSVVSGLTAYQNKMPVSQSIQRQLTLKTPDSKK